MARPHSIPVVRHTSRDVQEVYLAMNNTEYIVKSESEIIDEYTHVE